MNFIYILLKKIMGFNYIYIFFGYTLTDEQVKSLFKNVWENGEKKAEKYIKNHPLKSKKDTEEDSVDEEYNVEEDSVDEEYNVEDQKEDLMEEYFKFEFADEINKKLSGNLQNGDFIVYPYPCCMFNDHEGKPRWILGLKMSEFNINTVGSISIKSLLTVKSHLKKKLEKFNIEVTSEPTVHMVIDDCFSCT